jgi:hypothetical protein
MSKQRKPKPTAPDAGAPEIPAPICRSPISGAVIPCGKASPHSWQKGKSGNPSGSSAKRRMAKALGRAMNKKDADALARAIIAHAIAGDAAFARLAMQHFGLLDSTGRSSAGREPRVVIDLSGRGGGASLTGLGPIRDAPLPLDDSPGA